MNSIDSVTHGQFHISLPLWTIADLSNGKPVLMLDNDNRLLFPLFTDIDLAKQFIEDESPSPHSVPVEFNDHRSIQQSVLAAKTQKCTHVGIDLSNKSPIRAVVQNVDHFLASMTGLS